MLQEVWMNLLHRWAESRFHTKVILRDTSSNWSSEVSKPSLCAFSAFGKINPFRIWGFCVIFQREESPCGELHPGWKPFKKFPQMNFPLENSKTMQTLQWDVDRVVIVFVRVLQTSVAWTMETTRVKWGGSSLRSSDEPLINFMSEVAVTFHFYRLWLIDRVLLRKQQNLTWGNLWKTSEIKKNCSFVYWEFLIFFF